MDFSQIEKILEKYRYVAIFAVYWIMSPNVQNLIINISNIAISFKIIVQMLRYLIINKKKITDTVRIGIFHMLFLYLESCVGKNLSPIYALFKFLQISYFDKMGEILKKIFDEHIIPAYKNNSEIITKYENMMDDNISSIKNCFKLS